MYYIKETNKSFENASNDLDAAVKSHDFGVLYIHNLGLTLRENGIDFSDDCKVFEVCVPLQGAKVLAIDMHLNMALPCRISVFTENGRNFIVLIKPEKMLLALSKDPLLVEIAKEVERKTIMMVDAAK